MQGTKRFGARHGWLAVILTAVAAFAVAEEPASLQLAEADYPLLALKLSRELTPPASSGEKRPVFINADRIGGHDQTETVAEGNVELRRADTSLTADRLTYWPIEDEMEAVGNVRLVRGSDDISGPHLRLRLADSVGFFEHPEYVIQQMPKKRSLFEIPLEPSVASGSAERIDFEGEGQYRMSSATFSTCKPSSRDWYTRADEMKLDYDREVGEASNVTVVFKDTPILYSPWLSFSLNSQRKSGFLTPTFGSSTNRGLEYAQPWYWNIAPNMDATMTPRVMSKRGVQLNGEFRYLSQNYNGQTRVEYLPGDRLADRDRRGYAILHNHMLAPNLTATIDLNGVSDDDYFNDLSSRVTVTSQTNLIRRGVLSYSGGWWNASVQALKYQTLQDPEAPIVEPYAILPRVSLSASRPDLPGGVQVSVSGQYSDFSHPTRVEGQRTFLYPQLSLPLQTASLFLTTRIGIHSTHYNLERQESGVSRRQSRDVPIMSVDSGIVMERETSWNERQLIQTLEPRVYYVRIPYRDQSQIPVFDTALADFNFVQMFSENRYLGNDRIGDADQLTAAAVSRLIDPATGSELIRGALGQRFYFNDQKVTLPLETARTTRKTDILAAVSGRLWQRTFLDAGWQYSPSSGHTERFNFGARYQPDINRVLNASYRLTRDQIKQVDFSGQWPLANGWYGVGRLNYSIRDRSMIESLAGLEYDGGCWVARFVLHRVTTSAGNTSTGAFVQLELNGLARIGSNPIDMLKRNIPGYGVINQPTADPIFGSD